MSVLSARSRLTRGTQNIGLVVFQAASRKHVRRCARWSIASPSRKCRTERMAMGAWPTGVSRDVVNMWLALLDVFGSNVHVIRV